MSRWLDQRCTSDQRLYDRDKGNAHGTCRALCIARLFLAILLTDEWTCSYSARASSIARQGETVCMVCQRRRWTSGISPSGWLVHGSPVHSDTRARRFALLASRATDPFPTAQRATLVHFVAHKLALRIGDDGGRCTTGLLVLIRLSPAAAQRMNVIPMVL